MDGKGIAKNRGEEKEEKESREEGKTGGG